MASRVAVGVLKFYRRFLSPLHPPVCRFYPSCSSYAMEAFQRRTFWSAAFLTTVRLLRCQPFHPGGYDPVPLPSLSERNAPAGAWKSWVTSRWKRKI